MIHTTLALSEKYPDATLTTYICDNQIKHAPRAAVIVCPGGGYSVTSPREAEPIAKKFFAAGFNAYVLDYSVKEKARDFAPLIEAALAIKTVRERAEQDNTDTSRVFICGFSAGGHLAASAGTLWNIPEVRDAIGVTDGISAEGINRPDGMILCYPVITAGEFAHKGSIHNVSGHNPLTEADIEQFSLELRVDDTTPKTFIWHTFTDVAVPVENTLLFTSALARAKIPFESHIFPAGIHGLSLCNEETADGKSSNIVPHAECWMELAVKWINEC